MPANNACYVLKLFDKPGSLVPQLGLFGQGDDVRFSDMSLPAKESNRRPAV
jgi:hypothetical protein